MTALRTLVGLLRGSASSRILFPSVARSLAQPLSTQLGDRRSAIVKLASAATAELLCVLTGGSSAQGCIPASETIAEVVLPVLLRQVTLSVAVMSSSADHCVRRIIGGAPAGRGYPRLIPLLLQVQYQPLTCFNSW